MPVIHNVIAKEYQKMQTTISDLENQIKQLPKGKLFCTTNGKYHKWYCTTEHGTEYIPKKNRKLAEQLALKKLLSLQLEDAKQSVKALNFSIRHYNESYKNSAMNLFQQPEYRELLAPHFTPLDEELAVWTKAPYKSNTSHPEQLQFRTTSGIMVRSKSETIIDFILHTHRLPYRYECLLSLGNNTLFPDFTIRHPKTGEFFYWEHFGLMDDPGYRKNAMSKLQLYASHGIFPSINLITTYETKDIPLNPEYVNLLVSHYFINV